MISFAEEPDYSILPPSSEFVPDDNEGRYEACRRRDLRLVNHNGVLGAGKGTAA